MLQYTRNVYRSYLRHLNIKNYFIFIRKYIDIYKYPMFINVYLYTYCKKTNFISKDISLIILSSIPSMVYSYCYI